MGGVLLSASLTDLGCRRDKRAYFSTRILPLQQRVERLASALALTASRTRPPDVLTGSNRRPSMSNATKYSDGAFGVRHAAERRRHLVGPEAVGVLAVGDDQQVPA